MEAWDHEKFLRGTLRLESQKEGSGLHLVRGRRTLKGFALSERELFETLL
jgi:hypothetical protein